MVFVYLFLIYFSQYDIIQIHLCCSKCHYLNFLWLSYVLSYICITSSVFINQCIYAFFKKIILYWRIADLQCCVLFMCTEKQFSYTNTYIYFFQIVFPYMLLQSIEYGSCSIQHVFVDYLFYIWQCLSVNPNLLIYPSPNFHLW